MSTYLKLLLKLYRFNAVILKRYFISKTNRPASLAPPSHQLHGRGGCLAWISIQILFAACVFQLCVTLQENQIAVIVGNVTDDKRVYEVSAMKVAASQVH